MLWIAALGSNCGTLMHTTAAAWLMTTLTNSPVLVGLLQSAAFIPAFLFGLPGGALADALDRRIYLICVQLWMLLCAGSLGVLALAGGINAINLIVITFFLGIGGALAIPAWHTLVQDIVPREHLPQAITLNSIAFNIARSVGPAAGGWVTALAGAGSVFLLNAASFLGTLVLLITGKFPSTQPKRTGKRIGVFKGVATAMQSLPVRSAIIRTAMFVCFSSAGSTLLPLIAKDELGMAAGGFGLLLTVFGVGSILTALRIPALRNRFGADQVVSVATLFFVAGLVGLAFSPSAWTAAVSMFCAGLAWSGVMINFNVTVQTNSKPEARGQSMALYVTTFQGSFALGATASGALASLIGLRPALLVAAALLTAGWLLRKHFPLTDLPSETNPN